MKIATLIFTFFWDFKYFISKKKKKINSFLLTINIFIIFIFFKNFLKIIKPFLFSSYFKTVTFLFNINIF